MLQLFTTYRVTFLIIFAVLGTVSVIYDPDFYLHLVAGQYILEHHTLPHVDVFSYTMAGEPWHMHEWLFEVGVAALHQFGGEPLVVWVIAALGVGAYYILFRSGLGEERRGLLWLLPALALMAFYLLFVTQRPQVISYFCYALYLAALIAFKYRGQTRWLWLLPLLMVLWVNSHGGYLLGIGVMGLFTLSEWWLWQRQGREQKRSRQLKRLTLALVATVLASLINPYFVGHWIFPFELMGREAMTVISEWQRPDLGQPLYQAYLFCLVLFYGHYLGLKRLPDLTEWLLPTVVVAASFTAVRHIPLAAMTLLPFFMRTLDRPTRWAPRLRAGETLAPGSTTEMGRAENVMNLLLLIGVVTTLYLFSPALRSMQERLKIQVLPVKAADYLEREGITGKLFNQYRYGGYLLYRFYPKHRVFIDIRADMYGDAMMRDYTTLFFAAPGWEQVFDRYQFGTVLCEHDARLVKKLQARGDFKQVYRDAENVVLKRR